MKIQSGLDDQMILINHGILCSNFASKDKGFPSADKQIRELKLFEIQNEEGPLIGEQIENFNLEFDEEFEFNGDPES